MTLRHATPGRNLYLTTYYTDKRQISMTRRDSNPQSQQVKGRRLTPLTARPLWSAYTQLPGVNVCTVKHLGC